MRYSARVSTFPSVPTFKAHSGIYPTDRCMTANHLHVMNRLRIFGRFPLWQRYTNFQKSSNHLKMPGARRRTRCKFHIEEPLTLKTRVHPFEQKSIALKFSKSRTGSYVRYSCHHNSSRFTSPIFAHSWRFSVFHSLQ